MSHNKVHSISIIDCDVDKIQTYLDPSSTPILNISEPEEVTIQSNIEGISNKQKGEIQSKALRTINEFGDIKINNETVKDILSFGNSTVFFFHRFKILHLLTKHLIKVEEVNYQLDKFESINLYSSDSRLLKHFENNDKVDLHFFKPDKEKINLKSFLSFLFLMTFRILKGFSQYKFALKVPFALVDRPTDYVSTNGKLKNPFFENLLKKCSFPILLISEIPIYGFRGKNCFKSQKKYHVHNEKKDVIFGEFILLRAFLLHFKKWKQNRKELHQKLVNSFNNQWEANNKLIWEILVGLKSTTDLYILKEIAYTCFFEKSNVKTLVASDENSLSHRTIINAAKLNGIKTYGVQHGAIGKGSANYMYHSSDFNYSPVPDISFVWGNYWKNILEEYGNYPSKSIKVVGQLRTDEINDLLAKKIQQTSSRKRVLFATQPMPDEEWREKAMMDVLKLAANRPETDFIIRPHPRETDRDYFTSRIDKFELSNISIDGKTDLYLQLANVDLLITCYSTVALEALYFKIPVLLIDYYEIDILSFVKNKLAPLSRSYSEIESTYSILLSQSFNSSAVENYIEEYAYKIDGNVAERILKEINLNNPTL